MESKKLNFSGLFSIIKCCLLGIIFTLAGIVIFAIVLKFVDLPSNAVGYINDAIKGVSIFIMVLFLKRASQEKLLLKSACGGIIYSLLSLIIFSILNGSVNFNMTIVYDLIFAVIVAIVASVIVNLLSKKN